MQQWHHNEMPITALGGDWQTNAFAQHILKGYRYYFMSQPSYLEYVDLLRLHRIVKETCHNFKFLAQKHYVPAICLDNIAQQVRLKAR